MLPLTHRYTAKQLDNENACTALQQHQASEAGLALLLLLRLAALLLRLRLLLALGLFRSTRTFRRPTIWLVSLSGSLQVADYHHDTG